MTFIHYFPSFSFHSILSNNISNFMIIQFFCLTFKNFSMHRCLRIAGLKTHFLPGQFFCWLNSYAKFAFLFWRKLVGAHISIFKWHSKVLCANCAVCILEKCRLHLNADWKSADSQACTASSNNLFTLFKIVQNYAQHWFHHHHRLQLYIFFLKMQGSRVYIWNVLYIYLKKTI